MLENIDKKKVLVIGVACVVLAIIGAIYYFVQNIETEYIDFENEFKNNVENQLKNEQIEEVKEIIIHISGQVVNPGVITLNEGSRLIDAINLAGGATKEADLTKVNLAYVLEDAIKVYIPSINDKNVEEYIIENSGDTSVINNGSTNSKKEEKLMININTANETELEKLPGIGTSIASRIVAYRKENGKFNNIEDIKNVSGIGDSKFNNIKNNICVK